MSRHNHDRRQARAARNGGAIEFSAGPDLIALTGLPREEIARLIVRWKILRDVPPNGAAAFRVAMGGSPVELFIRRRGIEVTCGLRSDFERFGMGFLCDKLVVKGLLESWDASIAER